MKGGRSKADVPKAAGNKLAVKTAAKGGKDLNKLKRPPSSFFIFMEGFRKEFKSKNPNNKMVSVVGKAGGAKWKSMSEDEKGPYVAKAAKLKMEYNKNVEAQNMKQARSVEKAADEEEEESDKSKSEVNDSDEEGSGEEEDDEE